MIGRRAQKYKNKPKDGYASKKEANRAAMLKLMQLAGDISDLREQVEYELIPKQDGERAVKYRADFVYKDRHGILVAEDVKGFRTDSYIIKRKLMLFVHGVKITEV